MASGSFEARGNNSRLPTMVVDLQLSRSFAQQGRIEIRRYWIEADSSFPPVQPLRFPTSQASPGGFTPPTQQPPTAHLPTPMLAAGEGRNCGSKRDNVGWAGESFTSRKGATGTAQLPLQYMYCGLTNIMCAGLSIMESSYWQATAAHGLCRCK